MNGKYSTGLIYNHKLGFRRSSFSENLSHHIEGLE